MPVGEEGTPVDRLLPVELSSASVLLRDRACTGVEGAMLLSPATSDSTEDALETSTKSPLVGPFSNSADRWLEERLRRCLDAPRPADTAEQLRAVLRRARAI
mmetsp:Transcript_124787/g.195542  ORF Transcript_124787/g.195542 Transcript_124787/m.195542 type:complete len:102 (-) Transcript_124787:51-356(-)